MLGLTFDKLLILGAIAVFVIGPERLPGYAAQLARLVRTFRTMADGAKVRLKDEMGPDFDDIDWVKLDPRQYDPRRIIREALNDTARDAARGGATREDGTQADTTRENITRDDAARSDRDQAPAASSSGADGRP